MCTQRKTLSLYQKVKKQTYIDVVSKNIFGVFYVLLLLFSALSEFRTQSKPYFLYGLRVSCLYFH